MKKERRERERKKGQTTCKSFSLFLSALSLTLPQRWRNEESSDGEGGVREEKRERRESQEER